MSALVGTVHKVYTSDQRVRQSVCAVCGKTVGQGNGVVREFGACGRVHKTCAPAIPSNFSGS
jgi:hypothetical protein